MINKFINSYRWIARNPYGIIVTFLVMFSVVYIILWEITEPINIPDNILNLVNKRYYWYMNFTIILSFILTIILEIIFRKTYWKIYAVSYECHNQQLGWTGLKSDGELGGSPQNGYRMEAIKIKLGYRIPAGVEIEYVAHVEGIGWQNKPSKNGELAGTERQHKRFEAIRIKLINQPNDYSVMYSVRQAGENGWTKWYYDDEIAGSVGNSRAIEAIRIIILRA